MNRDTWSLVIALADLRTYAAVCRVCTEWRGIARGIHKDGTALCGYLRIAVAAADAGIGLLVPEGFERKLPFWYILANPGISWSVGEIMKRNDFSVDFILKHPKFRWCYRTLSAVDGLTSDMVISHIDREWDFGVLADRGLFTREMYTKYHKGTRDLAKLHNNGLITDDELIHELRKTDDFGISYASYSVDIRIVQLTPDINWDYRRLSYNPTLTPDYVVAHIGAEWVFGHLRERFR